MQQPVTLLHGGALGDLVLSIQFALRHWDCADLIALARVDLGDLRPYSLPVQCVSSETAGTAWLFGGSGPAPERLHTLVHGRLVLDFVGVDSARLQSLQPSRTIAIDARPAAGDSRHITQQWASQAGLPRRAEEHAYAEYSESMPPAPPEPRESGPILIHPGSGGQAKCWPLANFIAEARRLRAAGADVRFIVGEAELERWPGETIATLESEFPVLRPPTTRALVEALSTASAYWGNDSGPTHLAALLGAPVTVWFGPTDPRVWRPLGRSVTVIGRTGLSYE